MRSTEVSSPLEFDRCGAEADTHTRAQGETVNRSATDGIRSVWAEGN